MRAYIAGVFVVITLLVLLATYGGSGGQNTVQASELLPASEPTQGLLQVVNKEGKAIGECPLKHTSVSAEVAGFVARVDVTQEFVNPLSEPIEAVYVFPLPQDSAVDKMEMTVGERTIRAEIKKREEAKQIYEQAKEQGKTASLLDQERPNIFTQSVANILPGERVLIKISYVDLLKYDSGKYEFSFPMVVGPRYIPGKATGKTGEGWAPDTNETPDASKITPPVTPKGTRAGHDISLAVKINAGVPVGEVKSIQHEVEVDRTDKDSVTVRLRDENTIPNKDFVLRYQVAGKDVETGLLSSTRSAGDGYFSMVLVPPMVPTPTQIAPKEMIFVIDTSGSQMGWPIEKSKETMKLCIDHMNPNDTFQMMAFNNDVVKLFDEPKLNTPENRALAHEFLSARLGSGGTEMMKAILAALTPPPDPKRLRIVCFMTDGYVGNDMDILAAIKKDLGNARLFSFGIGSSPNRFLLDGMADMGRGAVEYVTLVEKGDEAAEKFYKRVAAPVFTDVSVDWGGLPISDEYPQRIPDLFSSQPVIIKGRYHGQATGTVTISGKVGGKVWKERIDVTLPDNTAENQALPSVWARAKIAELMKKDYHGLQSGNPDPGVKDEITRVALSYNLMSQFTSFVAVEEKVVTKGGKPTKVAVPVEMPEGVSYEGVFDDTSIAAASPAASGQAFYAYSAGAPAVKSKRALGKPSSPVLNASIAPLMEYDALEQVKVPTNPVDKLDPALRDLKGKLDKNGSYVKPGQVVVRKGSVRISIKLTDDSADKLAELKKLGFTVSSSSHSLKMVVGWAPVGKLMSLAKLGFVVKMTPVI